MKKNKVKEFPKGFFDRPMPIISLEESLKDSKPFEWSENVLNGKSKAIIVSGRKLKSKKRQIF